MRLRIGRRSVLPATRGVCARKQRALRPGTVCHGYRGKLMERGTLDQIS